MRAQHSGPVVDDGDTQPTVHWHGLRLESRSGCHIAGHHQEGMALTFDVEDRP